MPVLNLNGVARKNAKPIKGDIFMPGLASQQHGTVSVVGRSYNSPFTTSGRPLFNASNNNTTQPHLPALKVESPGDVVPASDFIKVHPTEKGTFFSTTGPARPIVGRVGGPSKYANTPANPNAPVAQPKQARPKRVGSLTPVEKQTHLSFLRSGGTIGGKAEPNAGVSSHVSRWSVTKKGVIA